MAASRIDVGGRVMNKRGGHWQLAAHIAAHIQHLLKNRRNEAASAVRELAVTVALDAYGEKEQHAVAWLEQCGVRFPKYFYQTALAQTRALGEAL